MKSILIGALLFGAWANPANAEDYDWSGIYGGVSIGARWSDVSVDQIIPNFDRYYSADGANFTGGGFIGYNFQSGNWVFGPSVSVEFTEGENGSDRIPTMTGMTDQAYLQDKYRSKATVTVNGRLGYAIGPYLPYVTAGYSRGWFDRSNEAVWPGFWSSRYSVSFERNGWNIGAGADWAVTNHIFARAEYRYNDFGSEDLGYGASRKIIQHAATLGIGYKF